MGYLPWYRFHTCDVKVWFKPAGIDAFYFNPVTVTQREYFDTTNEFYVTLIPNGSSP